MRVARSMVFMMVGASLRVRSSSLLRQAVRQQPRRRQDVAQVVVDLVRGRADLGQPRLLAQRGAQLALQVLELAVDDADLVVAVDAAAGRCRASSGSRRKATMSADRSCKRPDHQPAQREIEQGGGEQRDDDRQHQHAHGVVVHRDAHRQLVDHDPDHRAWAAASIRRRSACSRRRRASSAPSASQIRPSAPRSLRLKVGMSGRGGMLSRARRGLLGSTSTTASTRAWLSRARLTSSVTMLSGVASSASAARVPLSISCSR